jgi:hypothetical protein
VACRRPAGQRRDAEDGSEQGSALHPRKLPEIDQKPLTSPSFCSDLLTELPSGRVAAIFSAVCQIALVEIEFVGKNIHLINDL